MALGDIYSNVHLLVRWLHVIAGIIWVGHLYFFNFVNIPLQSTLSDDSKKILNPELMSRSLWWFRMGAMVTFLAGLLLFFMNYLYTPGQGPGPSALLVNPEGGMTGRSAWILFGMILGTKMWYNVWFVIWPIQRKFLTNQVSAEEAQPFRAKAAKASKMNTYLSGPMLFGMLGASHYGAANLVTFIVILIVGMIPIYWAYKQSSSIDKNSV